jgi:hypothetical protein
MSLGGWLALGAVVVVWAGIAAGGRQAGHGFFVRHMLAGFTALMTVGGALLAWAVLG